MIYGLLRALLELGVDFLRGDLEGSRLDLLLFDGVVFRPGDLKVLRDELPDLVSIGGCGIFIIFISIFM